MGIGDAVPLVAAVGYAGVNLCIRPLAGQIGSVGANATRSTVAAIFCLALLPLARLPDGLPIGALLFAIASATIGYGLGDSLSFASIHRIGVARATLVSSSYPLATTVLAVLLLGERVTPLQVLGILMTLGGVYLAANTRRLASPIDLLRGADRRGLVLAGLAALCWSISIVMVGPALTELDPLLVNAVRMALGASLLSTVAWRRQLLPNFRQAQRSLLWLLGLAGLITSASATCLVLGVKLAGAAHTSVLSATSPLFALALSAVLLDERLTVRLLVSAAFTIGGVWLLIGGKG